MKFSIVTISFNQAAFLERAIQSVLGQGYPDVEYILVDPGSTDGSRDIVERYRDRIQHVIFESDDGPADGLNKGFQRATGEICGYINADDAFLPGVFHKVEKCFQGATPPEVVYADGYRIDAKGDVLHRCYSQPFHPRRYAFGAGIVFQQATFFQRQAFSRVGGFNPENRTCWDRELLVDFWNEGMDFRLVDDFWGVFTDHEASLTHKLGSRMADSRQEKNRSERARLFAQLVGRPCRKTDLLLRVLYRIQKHCIDPRYFFRRCSDMFVRPASSVFDGEWPAERTTADV
jgi:glycosyltransferase involved in cell wall biosynthesis